MKNNRANTLWYKISNNSNFKNLVKKYREMAGIPPGGVNKSSGAFFEQLDANEKKIKKFTTATNHFINDVKKIYPLSEDFINELENYLVHNVMEVDKVDTTNCSMFSFSKANPFMLNYSINRGQLTAGVYIQIDPDSSISKLREFIEDNKKYIQRELDRIRQEDKIGKPKRERIFTNTQRDEYVYQLSKKSMEDLQLLGGGLSKYKEIRIESICKSNDYDISSDNIKQIIHRQGKIRNKSK